MQLDPQHNLVPTPGFIVLFLASSGIKRTRGEQLVSSYPATHTFTVKRHTDYTLQVGFSNVCKTRHVYIHTAFSSSSKPILNQQLSTHASLNPVTTLPYSFRNPHTIPTPKFSHFQNDTTIPSRHRPGSASHNCDTKPRIPIHQTPVRPPIGSEVRSWLNFRNLVQKVSDIYRSAMTFHAVVS